MRALQHVTVAASFFLFGGMIHSQQHPVTANSLTEVERAVIIDDQRLTEIETRLATLDKLNLDNRIAINEKTVADIKTNLDEANSWLRIIATALISLGGSIILWLSSRLFVFVARKPLGPDNRMP